MKEIKAWKTDDGAIYEDEEAAKKHQDYIGFSQELNIIIEESDLLGDNNDKQDIYNYIEKIIEIGEREK